MVFPELFQDLRDVVAMFGQVPGLNQDVIDVHYDKSVEKLPEHLVHNPLVALPDTYEVVRTPRVSHCP